MNAGEGVGELCRPPAVVDVGRLPEARGVPRDQCVVSSEIGGHPLPGTAVGRRSVQHDKRWACTRTGEGDPQPVEVDVLHA